MHPDFPHSLKYVLQDISCKWFQQVWKWLPFLFLYLLSLVLRGAGNNRLIVYVVHQTTEKSLQKCFIFQVTSQLISTVCIIMWKWAESHRILNMGYVKSTVGWMGPFPLEHKFILFLSKKICYIILENKLTLKDPQEGNIFITNSFINDMKVQVMSKSESVTFLFGTMC